MQLDHYLQRMYQILRVLKVLKENGITVENGQIKTSELINIVENVKWEVADIADLNGDGKSDIFWRQTQSGQSYMYLMNGIGIVGRDYGDSVGNQWQVMH